MQVDFQTSSKVCIRFGLPQQWQPSKLRMFDRFNDRCRFSISHTEDFCACLFLGVYMQVTLLS